MGPVSTVERERSWFTRGYQCALIQYCGHHFIGNFGQHPSNQGPWLVDIRSDFIRPTDAECANSCCIAVVRVQSVVSCDLMMSSTCEDVHSWFELEKATCAVEVKGVKFDVLSWIWRNALRGVRVRWVMRGSRRHITVSSCYDWLM